MNPVLEKYSPIQSVALWSSHTTSENGKVRFDEYVQFLDFRERIIATEGR